jgi:ABC-type transporter Mla subunit MlaD
MSLRKSQQPPEQQPTEEEHILTGQEPDTSTKIAEGSVLVHRLRDNDNAEGDPVLKNVADVLERNRPKLSHQQWYNFLQTVRDCSNRHEELTRMLNEIDTGAAELSHIVTERGIVDSV